MKLTTAWGHAIRYTFSRHAWQVMGRGLYRALPIAMCAVLLLVTLNLIAQHELGHLSKYCAALLSVVPPLIAIVGSPLYLLPLIRLHDQTKKHHPWLPYLSSGALFYGLGGAIAWAAWQLYVIAPLWATITLSGLALLLLPLVIVLLWISPFLMTAYAYEPMASCSRKKIWHHARLMSWHDFPFISFLLVCMMPFGLIVYGLPGVLLTHGFIDVRWLRPLLHIGSVVYWLLGWSVFIVYYQDRKKRYMQH